MTPTRSIYWTNPMTGVIRRKVPKVRGKAAVKAHKRARMAVLKMQTRRRKALA